jgi:hypothetical protein
MKNDWLLRWLRISALLIALIAAPVHAVEDVAFPMMLVNATCTDTEDTVDPAMTGRGPAEFVQISGSADGLCDYDHRVVNGADIQADVTLGPITGFGPMGYIDFNVTAATGGNGGWRLGLYFHSLQTDAAKFLIWSTAGKSGASNSVFAIGHPSTDYVGGDEMKVHVPDPFYVRLDLNTATNWTGSISLVPAPDVR